MQCASSIAISAGFRFASISGKPAHAQPLRRDEEKLQLAVQIIDAHLARGRAIAPGVDAFHREAAFPQLGELIFHQRDQRTDHQRRARRARARAVDSRATSPRRSASPAARRAPRSPSGRLLPDSPGTTQSRTRDAAAHPTTRLPPAVTGCARALMCAGWRGRSACRRLLPIAPLSRGAAGICPTFPTTSRT